MGFTNQIFKWIGDVANDLGEGKANNMFMGVAGGAKSASTGMAQAGAMKQAMPTGDGGGDKNKDKNKEATQVDSEKK